MLAGVRAIREDRGGALRVRPATLQEDSVGHGESLCYVCGATLGFGIREFFSNQVGVRSETLDLNSGAIVVMLSG